jgi:hypothetical protein
MEQQQQQQQQHKSANCNAYTCSSARYTFISALATA